MSRKATFLEITPDTKRLESTALLLSACSNCSGVTDILDLIVRRRVDVQSGFAIVLAMDEAVKDIFSEHWPERRKVYLTRKIKAVRANLELAQEPAKISALPSVQESFASVQ